MERQEIVHTVQDQHGAWAMFVDEAPADLYAVRVHGVRGPDMTREQARRLVAESMLDELALQRILWSGADVARD